MADFNFVASSRRILGDLHTPVGVYLKLRDISPRSVLMECSDYHDSGNSRSFIGIRPMASISVGHGSLHIEWPDGSVEDSELLPSETDYVGDKAKLAAVGAINRFIGSISVSGDGAQYCGLYGFTSFNAVRYFENIAVKDETMEENDAPDILYIMYKDIIVFDHFNNTMTLVHVEPALNGSYGGKASGDAMVNGSAGAEVLAPAAVSHVTSLAAASVASSAQSVASSASSSAPGTAGEAALDELEKLLSKPVGRSYGFKRVGETYSTLSDEEHMANVRRCVKHCLRGDVFQIVISRRFIQRFEGDDFKLYRALRSINPSPYLFYFDFGGFRILGSSPETHCRIEGDKAFIDPIAGTTKRTGNAEQDRRNAEFLRNDPKENAEHVMLVDLARNDLSRNCHDVKVEFYKDMQFYSHVIHLVSRVGGTLAEGADKIGAFVDTFPAGTLSGAPKVRAMQIISELEPHNRGIYGGCIGYIGLNGDLNQAIVIRTFISRNGELWFQAGSGIVAKSNDVYELEEVNSKLGALAKALGAAETL